MLSVGNTVPSFKLSASDDNVYSPATLKGKRWVLFFYPKDMTPGCTVEACTFTAKKRSFSNRETLVLGISGGSLASKQKFVEKEGLKIPLLADEDFSVASKFGAYGPKMLYGKKFNGITRSTFIVGTSGKIEAVWPKVKVDGHIQEVLDFLSGNK